MKYISIILMSLFLVGNANADKKGKYGYVLVSVDEYGTPGYAWLYNTLKECKMELIDSMEYDTKKVYRVEFVNSKFDFPQTRNYWKNERQPNQVSTCVEVDK